MYTASTLYWSIAVQFQFQLTPLNKNEDLTKVK